MAREFLDKEKNNRVGDIGGDAIDLRDRVYSPTLMPLRPKLPLDATVTAALQGGTGLAWLPRNQGSEGSCAGHALAALIDIQRYLHDGCEIPVSARMLYQMARRQNEPVRWQKGQGGDAAERDGTTLRAVIKGLYHNGVCAEKQWPYVSGDTRGELDIVRAKDARSVPLGAYYRLHPNLGDYHAALNECGVVLVAAGTHSGWSRAQVSRNGGRIVPALDEAGGHAFVVVGYDDTGFHVLNSWGADWGGFERCRGLAHWSYQDWADTIMDGWVLRLGVSAPGAFHLTLGDQGMRFMLAAGAEAVTTPGHDVLGHMAHLDDGRPVGDGAYAFSMKSFEETIRYLGRVRPAGTKLPVAREWDPAAPPDKRGYRGVILRFGGSLLGLKDMAAQVAREKPLAKERGLYPFTIAWCNDFVDRTEPILNSIFDEAFKQVGRQGNELDELIEERVHGIGRAFWRDVQRAARRSARVGAPAKEDSSTEEVVKKDGDDFDGPAIGPAVAMLEAFASLPGLRLHLIADGAGVMLLRKVLAALARLERREKIVSRIETLDLITPTIDRELFELRLGDVVQSLAGKGDAEGGGARCVLHVPAAGAEKRLAVGLYSRSILDLVENGFSSPEGRPDYIGKSLGRTRLRSAWKDNPVFGSILLSEIDASKAGTGPIAQADLQADTRLFRSILERIAPGSQLPRGGRRPWQRQRSPSRN